MVARTGVSPFGNGSLAALVLLVFRYLDGHRRLRALATPPVLSSLRMVRTWGDERRHGDSAGQCRGEGGGCVSGWNRDRTGEVHGQRCERLLPKWGHVLDFSGQTNLICGTTLGGRSEP
jgi:hypothetical protein